MPRTKLTAPRVNQGKGISRLTKAAKASGPISAGVTQKKCHYCPIVHSINKFQCTTNKLVPWAPMKRVIWEEGKDYLDPFRSTIHADDAFIEMMEGYLVRLFDGAGSLAVHARRETIKPEDLYLASRIRGDHKSTVSTQRLEKDFWQKASKLAKEKIDRKGGRGYT